jgi:L-fucose isomerase-like protein
MNNRVIGDEYVMRAAWTAHRGALDTAGAEAAEYLGRLLPGQKFTMTDRSPDIILFMSGGSERRAIELSDPARPVLLLSVRGNNAYAAATEVMAWMVNHNRIAMLSDAADAAESGLIDRWKAAVGTWEKLKGRRAGLIGTVSEWLVASDVQGEILDQRFGIELKGIPWMGLPDYSTELPDADLLNRFRGRNHVGIEDAARVLTLLRRVISDNRLDAIGVECFSLVQQRKVTACLALAQLNTEGTVSACEGDLASMAGMMAGKALTGKVPWMANTTRLTENTLVLSHCTAPFDFVVDVELLSHYETGWSLAVDGSVTAKEVTVFRFSDTLDRAFIAEGMVISRPRMTDACRTQVEIALPRESIRVLKERPLGNHLLMVEGRISELLRLACRYRGIDITV